MGITGFEAGDMGMGAVFRTGLVSSDWLEDSLRDAEGWFKQRHRIGEARRGKPCELVTSDDSARQHHKKPFFLCCCEYDGIGLLADLFVGAVIGLEATWEEVRGNDCV